MSRQLAFATRVVEAPYTDADLDEARASMRKELTDAGLTDEELDERGKWKEAEGDSGSWCMILSLWVG